MLTRPNQNRAEVVGAHIKTHTSLAQILHSQSGNSIGTLLHIDFIFSSFYE